MKKTESFKEILIVVAFILQLCYCDGSLDEGSINFRRESALLKNHRPPLRHAESIDISNANVNINHIIDYLHTLRRSHDQMIIKIAELTRKLEARDAQDDRTREKFTQQLSSFEDKISLLEHSMPVKDIHQNTMPMDMDNPVVPKARQLDGFIHLEEEEDKFVPVNKLVEESRRSIEIFNSTLEDIKENISSMENQIIKFNETHTNEIQTVVNMESQIENKLESSCKDVEWLKMKHHELNFTVHALLNHISDLVSPLHEENSKVETKVNHVSTLVTQLQEENSKVETKVSQALDTQKLATVELRRQITGFKSSMKRQIQNISAIVGEWQKEDNAAITSLATEVYLLQEQVKQCNNSSNGLTGQSDQPMDVKTKSLMSTPIVNLAINEEYEDDLETIKQEIKFNRQQIHNISSQLNKVNVSQLLILRTMEDETLTKKIRPKDCSEIRLFRNGSTSGVYTIYPGRNDQRVLDVICDLETDGGGWTVIQRRGVSLKQNEIREDFFRDWSDYEKGFGSIDKDYWIGLKNLAALCQLGTRELRIELSDWNGEKRYANYKNFRISDWADLYRLHVAGYSGTAGDSLTRHNGMAFSTWDRDNDIDIRRNCAHSWRGAWWYYNCYESNLNGQYAKEGTNGTHEFGTGIIWYHWTDNYYSLKTVEMKIRNLYMLN